MKDYESLTEAEWAATWAVEQAAAALAAARHHERSTRPSVAARERLAAATAAFVQAKVDYRAATGQEWDANALA